MADIKLLLVEDDGNLAFVEKNTLEDVVGGYEIITACNGKDGIKAWEHSSLMLSSQILTCLS